MSLAREVSSRVSSRSSRKSDTEGSASAFELLTWEPPTDAPDFSSSPTESLAHTWPTPAARDYKGANGPGHLAKARGHHDQLPNAVVLSGLQAPMETGAKSTPDSFRLNPAFVEWLMGWPENWSSPYGPTGFARSEMASSQLKPKQRSASSTKKSVRSTSDHSDQRFTAPKGDFKKDGYEKMASEKRKQLMKRLSEASASGVGNNFKDGKYRLAVKRMTLEEGFKGNRFQAIFTVMHSAKIHVISPLANEVLDITPNLVGSDVDWLQMLDEKDSPGPGNVRRLFMDLFNKKEISNDEYLETLAEMCDLDEEGDALEVPLNLCKGMVIDMETLRIVTKKNKKEIVVQKWSYVEQTEEERLGVVDWMNQVTTHKALAAENQQQASA